MLALPFFFYFILAVTPHSASISAIVAIRLHRPVGVADSRTAFRL